MVLKNLGGCGFLFLVASLTGCAGVTEVVQSGNNTYFVASHGTMGWSSGGAQKADAITKANEYCQSKSQQMEIITASDSGNGGFGKISSAEVHFRCVKAKSQ